MPMSTPMPSATAGPVKSRTKAKKGVTIAKAKAKGVYKGRPVNDELHRKVKRFLGLGMGVRETAREAGCSTTTVLKIRDQVPG